MQTQGFTRPFRRTVSVIALGLMAWVAAGQASADTVTFSDQTFNLNNYTTTAYTLSGYLAPTVTSSQAANSGNPGNALETSFTFPASGSYDGGELYLNNTWVYDPSTQGALLGLSFSAQRMVDNPDFSSNTITSIVEQNGNYYYYSPPNVSVTADQFYAVSASDLQASSYTEFNPTTGAIDAGVNPNFSASGAAITFGLRATSQPYSGAGSMNYYTADVSYTLSPVPLPATARLMLSGLGGLGLLIQRQRAAGT